MDHRYGLQRGWENNSALEGYGHVDEPDFRVDGSYDDRRFVDDRHVSENGYSRSAYHRDIVERERYPVQPVGPWPQARRGGYEDEYPVERESRHHEKAYADTYSDIGSRRMDSYRDHGFYRSSRFTGRDDDDYVYDDYDYRTRISSREDIRERDYDYGRYSYDSDYERSRRDGSRRRDSHDHNRSKESEEKDQSPYRRRGGSRSSSRGHDDRLRSSSHGHDDRLRSSSRGHDDRLRSSSRGYDDRLRSSSRGHDDRLRSSSRGQDYRLRSRSPQRRSRSRSRREDSYDNIHYERSDKGRDHEGRHHRDLFSVAPSATVVVKGLSHKTTEEDLYQILAEWGPLRHVRVIKERDSGISRGFAFLDFPTVGAAQTMMDKLGDEGLVVDGRKLFFEYSSKPTGSASGSLGSDNVSRSGYGSHRSVAVPSDWMCTFCGCVNFARRTSCFQCNEPRTDDAPPADMASSNPVPGKRGEAGPTHVLVVRGLDENADEEILRYEFSKHAPIKDLRLVRDKFTHVSRGFAFVHFYSIEDATKALEATNGTTLEKNGQILRVAYAKSVLGPGSGPSGATQSSSLAAAAIEAATFSQQYDAVGWTPKEYNPEDKQSTGGQGHGAGVHGQSGAGPGAPQSNFVWDEASGYYYDASSGFYYDGNTGLYYDGNNGIWYTYDHQTQQYAPFSDQNDKASEKQSEAAVDGGSSKRKVVISAPAATINLTAKAVASLPDAIHAAASAAIAAEKKEKEKAKEIKLASKSSILANKKKMNNVLTMWKHRSHEGGQAPRVALDDNPVPSATTPEDRGNATAGSSSMKNKFKTELVITKENVAVSVGFSTGEESQDRANKSGGGGTLKGVIRGSGFGVVKSDTLYTGIAANSVGLGSSSSLSNMDSSFVVTPFRTDSSALGSYAPPVTGRRRFSEMPTQPSPVSNKEQRQTTYRDRAAERRSLYGSSSSLGDISETGDSNRDSTHRRIATDSMPFPPGVGVGGGGGGRSAGDDNVQSFEVITADRAIDESNVGNRMLRNMGWQEGLGLGKDGSGMVEPVQAQSVEKRAGLGSQPKKTTDPSLEVQSGDSYKTLIQKKAIARFREMA